MASPVSSSGRRSTILSSGWTAVAHHTKISIGENLPIIAHQSQESCAPSSTMATFGKFVTCMIGAGIVSFPKVFADGGWVAAPIILAMCCWISIELGAVINSTLIMCEEEAKAKGAVFSFGLRPGKYEDMFEVPFGPLGKKASCIASNFFLLMLCGAFIILIGQSMEYVLRAWIPYRVCVLCIGLIFVPLTLLNDMSVIDRLSIIGVIASVLYVIAIGSAGLMAGSKGLEKPLHLAPEPGDAGGLIAVMLMGFGYQLTVPSMKCEMLSPQELPRALNGSIVVVAIVYLIAGVLGYYGWGSDVKDNVLDNMLWHAADGKMKPTFPGMMLALAIIANLCVTFPLVMNCVAVAFEMLVMGEYSAPFRLGLLSISFSVGFFCPYFFQFFTITASLLCVSVGVLMPLAAFWALKLQRSSEKETYYVDIAKHSVIVIAALITMVCGTIDGFQGLMKALNKPDASYFGDFWKPNYKDF